jgi:hypothetical protein
VDVAAAIGPGAQLGGEGIAIPELDRIDWLDVVMAVEEEVGRAPVLTPVAARVVADDDRVAGRVGDARLEADPRQVIGQPFGRLAAFGSIGWVGRHGLEAHQPEEAVERSV